MVDTVYIDPAGRFRGLGSRGVGDDREKLLSSAQLAQELGVSRSAVWKWTTGADGSPQILTPAVTTPGGHHRYYLSEALAQLREARQRGDS